MRIIDITVVSKPGMVVWPGDPEFALRQVSSIDQGQKANISLIRMSAHTGTHIDAPKHFFDSGITIDQIPLGKLIGETLVLRVNDQIKTITKEVIKAHPLSEHIDKVKKILFHTSNSEIWHTNPEYFQHDFVGIDSTGAEYLAQFDLDLIGVDYLSIAPFAETDAPHKILLLKDVVLLEGIDLSEVSEGLYEIYCLPILLGGSDGAPARVILIER